MQPDVTARAIRERDGSMLDLAGVTVIRGGRNVLTDLTMRVDVSERVAIIGPNGSGKSTLLKTIARECYPAPQAGTRCRVMGRERWNVFELRTLLGIVSSDLEASFEPSTTLRDVVLSGFHGSLSIGYMHAVSDQMSAQADRALERLGIAHLANRGIATVSSGEARRAVIARALVHDPRALIFDEPSTALDVAAQRSVRDAMRHLVSAGTGIVLVTHHLDDVLPEIDRIILLRRGTVFADGRKDGVLRDALLSELFETPIHVERNGQWYRIAP